MNYFITFSLDNDKKIQSLHFCLCQQIRHKVR